MIIDTTNAIRPSSSASAKPMRTRVNWLSEAAGLRTALSRNGPQTLPTPIAAAPTPIAARPAPITWAAARSITKLLGLNLVKVDRFVQIDGGQQSEDISLDETD